MKIHKISWFDDFICMGGNCPQTCCRGWLIPLDEEDLERFKQERGRLGLALFVSTRAYSRNRMNLGSGECFFHAKSGLCSLQLKKGHDFIPWACRSFPRFYRNYGEFEERYLDLSCFAAARMFVENAGNLRLTKDEDEPATKLCTTNDDTDYLHALLDIRASITAPGGRFFWHVYKYSCLLQDTYARGGSCKDLPTFAEYADKSAENGNKLAEDAGIALLPLNTLKKFVDTAIYHFGLRRSGPELYTLLTDTQKAIEKYRSDAKSFKDRACDLLREYDRLLLILDSYMSYYLYQYFLDAYETYSFRKVTALGIIHTNMILLLAMTVSLGNSPLPAQIWPPAQLPHPEQIPEPAKTVHTTKTEHHAKLTDDVISYIIAVYNRKAFFNETIEEDMYRIFCDDI